MLGGWKFGNDFLADLQDVVADVLALVREPFGQLVKECLLIVL